MTRPYAPQRRKPRTATERLAARNAEIVSGTPEDLRPTPEFISGTPDPDAMFGEHRGFTISARPSARKARRCSNS